MKFDIAKWFCCAKKSKPNTTAAEKLLREMIKGIKNGTITCEKIYRTKEEQPVKPTRRNSV